MSDNPEGKICIVIPARIDSQRFPKKVLWEFLGIPMIEHVYRRACLSLPSEHVFIASGDNEILSKMSSLSANVLRSSKEHLHGTSRVAEAVESLDYNHVIILQADELLIDPSHLKALIDKIHKLQDIDCFNLITNIEDNSQLADKNIVKCFVDSDLNITHLFRLEEENKKSRPVYKIMGTISMTKQSLIHLSKIQDSKNQEVLSIEQLKIIENDFSLTGVIVDSSYPSINTFNETQIVKAYVDESIRQKQILASYVQL
ncbi:MAG: 3-deoxy-manno-octulosonate cytidylyltransferase [Actinobacteria bacterium]|nr:3-deoxy-manno-octulosonate cytidylyltransferase [Actinomycetota bacterium]